MNPDCESLRAELHAEIDRRIDAVEKKAADVEPPKVSEDDLRYFNTHCATVEPHRSMITRLRYVEAELARLREGLKVQEGDVDQHWLDLWFDKVPGYDSCFAAASHEITRHRALVKP